MLKSCIRGWAGSWIAIILLGVMAVVPCRDAAGSANESATLPDFSRLGVAGGLCIEIGCSDIDFAARLARSGRFIVQSVDADKDSVARTREAVNSQELYGLVSAVALEAADRLPYAENLVNVAVLRDCPHIHVPLAEIIRVVCPGGLVLAPAGRTTEAAFRAAGLADVPTEGVDGRWRVGRKPWPSGMDQWSHPWHAADGNTVSQDVCVGLPRCVRWIAGPEVEISNMVTSGGRNYYGGIWTRDAFNGLRLWEQDLKPSPAQGNYSFKRASGNVRPIAVDNHLVAVTGGTVCALDGATGQLVRTYPEAGHPNTLLHVNGNLLTVGAEEIRCLDFQTGRLLWKHATNGPRYVVASDKAVFMLESSPKQPRARCLALSSGSVVWQNDQYPWLPLVRRIVAHADLVVFEISTLSNTKEGNAIQVASAADGKVLWSREFVPGMNHMKQARAMFIDDTLWLLELDKQCVALNPRTGEVKQKYPAGLCHCFPPVATPRFLFSGEMELTDLATGQMDAQRITKANCSRDAGWVPANGLIYTTPKHCVCWPMLRGYVALAPQSPSSTVDEVLRNRRFRLETGCEGPSQQPGGPADWPCYRHDSWRSGAAEVRLPSELKVLWTTRLGALPEGTIAKDWRENPFVHGPITAPVAAGQRVYVARPDAHQVVVLDLKTGGACWRFTADGRVDTPPTIHRGLCLFGTRSGSVYCLRADDGRMVWRFRAAPSDQQIVAYGQIESPWPVPGSVLVIDDVAYFAAGRQSLADGGILLFAVQPATGQLRWVQNLDSLPMRGFYESTAMEFDNFDLLQQEGDYIAMSRWLFHRETGQMVVKPLEVFSRLKTGDPGVVAQRGVWTYAPRHQPRVDKSESLPRSLAVFHKNMLLGSSRNQHSVFRKDFNADEPARFDTKWMTGWAAGENFRSKTGDAVPVDRLARNAKWSKSPWTAGSRQQRIAAMVLAGDRVAVAGADGQLAVLSADNGDVVFHTEVPAPLWDGMAAASEHLLLSTRDGSVVCLGASTAP